MVSLKIIIDDSLLCSYIIANYEEGRFIPYATKMYKEDIVALQDLAWGKSIDLCMVLDGRYPIYKYKTSQGVDYKGLGVEFDNFISELITTNEYKKLKEQTKESKENVLNEWEGNFKVTSKYISDLGFEVIGEHKVYLVHPGLKAGHNIGNGKIIWSHQEYWPNYNTIYLWHEILHSYIEQGDEGHALIELITDEEMRVRLNGGEYPPYVGHKYLSDEKDKMLPKWKDYLENNKTDIKILLNT